MKKQLRRSGITIMAKLIVLLGSLCPVMILAILNGTLGFLSAMGVTIAGAAGVAKALAMANLCQDIPLSWGWIIAIAVSCGVLRGFLRYFEQYSNHYIAFKLLAELRSKIFSALRRLCPAKLESKKKGNIIAMITSDIETLEVFYAHTISPICIAALVCLAVFLFVGFVSSWYLALIALLGFLVIGILVPVLSSKRLKESGFLYRQQLASFHSYFLDSIKGVREIVLNNGEKERGEEVDRRSDSLLAETKKMKKEITKASSGTELLVSLFLVLSLSLGIVLVSLGSLDLGRMIIGVVAIFGGFGPVLAVSSLPGNLTQTFASGDRILNLLQEEPAVLPVQDGKVFRFENLRAQDLSFSYERNIPVLKDICLQAKKGEIVGIVGKSGCGKSTFLKLLLRFWEKEEGTIEYDGIDIDDIDSDNLLGNVTLVSQTTYLFDESVEENLKMAKPEATQEEIEEACKRASIHDFILSLPEGYKTKVGSMKDNLSAGEKQRIGLARAFLSHCPLILLDEPTSNVDSINEGMILESLARQRFKKSIILVSHRESTMAIADRIYRIEEGIMREERR